MLVTGMMWFIAFGTLHHISHELSFLKRIYQILDKDGELRVALYSKYSFF